MATTTIHPYRVRRSALRIAAIYAVLAFAWISLSDVLIELFVRDVDTLTQIQMLKGGLFVVVTSVVLWLLIKHDMRRLVNSERRYRMLFEAFQDAVFVVTPDGRFRDANNAALALSGYTLDELRALQADYLFTLTDEAPRSVQSASSIAQQTLRAKSGTVVFVEIAISPLMYNDEAVFAWVARDISERQRSKEAMRQSEARFRSLFEAAPVGIATSRNGVTIAANPTYLSLFGYDEISELAGTSLLQQIAPEHRDEIITRNRRREAGEVVPSSYETVGLRKDGTRFPFSVNGTRIDSIGGPSTLVFVTDISDRKQAEMQLRTETARVRILADIARLLAEASMDQQAVLATITERTAQLFDAPCTIWLLSNDRKTLHLAANFHPDPEMRDFLHHALDNKQLVGEGLHRGLLETGQGVLIPSVSPQAMTAVIKTDYIDQIERLGVQSMMLVPLRVRNHIIGMLATCRRHEQGIYTEADLAFFQELADQAALAIENARLFSTNVRELDERKRTEAALAASEERFRTLSASAPIGICFANVHGQCVYTNPHFQTIVGLHNEATLGIGWTTVVHPDDRERVLAEWRTCAAKGLEQSTEFRFKRLDGTVRWVRARYAPMRSDAGVRMGLVGTIEDVTERLQATQALRRVEQQLHTVISNAPLVLFAIDHNGVFTMAEGKGLAALGLSSEQLVGKLFFEVYQSLPDAYLDGPIERDPVRRALNGEEHTSIDILGGLTFETRWSPARSADGSVTGVTAVALDITERRRAEGEREKLASLVEHSSDAIGIASFDGKLLFLNSAGQQLLGISSYEVKDTPVANFFAGDDYTYIQRYIVPTILHEGRWFGEFRFKNNTTGAVIPIDLNGFLVRDHYSNEPVALACVGRNITERKRADEILRASEATNRALLNAVPDMMFRISSQGIFLAYKPGKDQGVLLPPETFIGNHVYDVMPPHVAEQTLERMEMALRTGETQVFEYALHLDGISESNEYEARLVRNGAQEILAIVRDITERKRMERSLRESEMLQQAVLEGTTDTVFLKDSEGRYLLMNPAGAAVLGLPINEIVGKRDEAFFPLDVVKALREGDQEVQQTGNSIEIENTFNINGRNQTFLSVKAPYRNQEGVIQGVIGISRDITERKRMERIKDDFLALASHELKTPLATLVGYVHLLQRWSAKNNFGERANHALASMQMEAMRLDRLINDLLDVSRIQTGRLQIHLRPIDLRNHLTHVVGTVQLAIPDHTIVLEGMPTNPLWCNADAQRLEQVLINLLTNAAKYSYEGRPIQIGVIGRSEHIEITVRDQGIGIPAADLPFIFDRFYQVQRPARESRPGMGLGLFITQEIVRQHGGTLSVESQEEIGSCFTVRLPYAIVMNEEVTSNATSTICPST